MRNDVKETIRDLGFRVSADSGVKGNYDKLSCECKGQK